MYECTNESHAACGWYALMSVNFYCRELVVLLYCTEKVELTVATEQHVQNHARAPYIDLGAVATVRAIYHLGRHVVCNKGVWCSERQSERQNRRQNQRHS